MINQKKSSKKSKSNSGFIIADFLFAFVLVIGIGIFIFALTFSLATIEITQYIVWSTARNYAAGNVTADKAEEQAKEKFNNLRLQFPLLSGTGSTSGGSSWFEMEDVIVGDLVDGRDADLIGKISADKENRDANTEKRQPWTGASSRLNLKLFAGLQIPFLGPVAETKSDFAFPIRAFIIRSPSIEECQLFFSSAQRLELGLRPLEQFSSIDNFNNPANYFPQEDNGC